MTNIIENKSKEYLKLLLSSWFDDLPNFMKTHFSSSIQQHNGVYCRFLQNIVTNEEKDNYENLLENAMIIFFLSRINLEGRQIINRGF